MKKPSFLERLTGSSDADEYDDVLSDEHEFGGDDAVDVNHYDEEDAWQQNDHDDELQEGELPADMPNGRCDHYSCAR